MPSAVRESALQLFRRAARTVVVVDLVDSVRLIDEDEVETIVRWQAFVRDHVEQLLVEHGGRLVKSLGDGLLLEFEAAGPALRCALAMHRVLAQDNHARPPQRWMCLRVGAHVADVIVDERDIYGSGVNIAARIAGLGSAGDTIVSADVRDQVIDGLDVDVEDLGQCYLKHIDRPVHAYKVGGTREVLFGRSDAIQEKALHITIAVIPFTGRLFDPTHAAIGELIADTVIVRLSRHTGIRVISRLSTTSLRDRTAAVAEARARLGATYALTGAFSVVADKVMATCELIDARSSEVVWSDRIAVGVSDLVDPDSQLAQRLIEGVMRGIERFEVKRARTQPLPTLESFALQIGAVTLMHRSARSDFERVRELLDHLVERHPRLPTPRAWLAKWHILRVTRGIAGDLKEEARAALVHTKRALESDPDCALALAMEGFVHCHMHRDLTAASERYDRALEADPNEPMAWLFKSMLHAFRGEGPIAIEAAENAIALSPLDPLRYYYDSLAASAAFSAGQYQRAAELAAGSLRLNRTHLSTWRVLLMAQALGGKGAEAQATARELLRLDPGFSVSKFLERSPAAAFEIGQVCARAFRSAGIPD